MTHEHQSGAPRRERTRPGGGEPLRASDLLLATELLRSAGVEWPSPPPPKRTPGAPPRPALHPTRVSDPEAARLLYGMGIE